jgi:hypothetical protein
MRSTKINMLANVTKSNSESKTNLSEPLHSKLGTRLEQRNFEDEAVCPEALAQRRPEKLLKLVSNAPAEPNLCENPADFRV